MMIFWFQVPLKGSFMALSLGTLLTIFVVPTMYTLFARKAVPGAITAPERDVLPASPEAVHPVGEVLVK